MNIDSKLQLFLGLVRYRSSADVKKQVGDEGVEIIQCIGEACVQHDSKAVLQQIDRYLVLASAAPRAIEVEHAELRPEAFNDIRDALGDILKELSELDDSSDPAADTIERRPKLRFEWLRPRPSTTSEPTEAE